MVLRTSWDSRNSAGLARIRLARLTAGCSELPSRGVRFARALALVVLMMCASLPASAFASGSVYVGNQGSANVSQHGIGAGGGLSPYSPATVAAGEAASDVAVTPDGRSAYVTNQSGTVSQYDVNPLTGALSPKTPATVAAGTKPFGIAVTPDGKSAYVANETDNTVRSTTLTP